MRPTTWLLLQLSDAAFPSGGFSHSSGFEAASVLSKVSGSPYAVERFLDHGLRQIGRASLPFVRASASDPSRLHELDLAFDARCPIACVNRASRAQGRSIARAATSVWDVLTPIADHARGHPAHYAPIYGAIFGALGLGVVDALASFLHVWTRGVLGAAVRLGRLGPLEAQRIHADKAPLLASLVEEATNFEPKDAAQTAPLLEIFAGLHDQLDARMFQS